MRNFGKIKSKLNDLLVDGIITKNEGKKDLFKKYLKLVKESDILKAQFFLYNNIESRIEDDVFGANVFITENIKLLDKFDKKDILKENLKLSKLVEDVNDYVYPLSELHESLTALIFTNKTGQNMAKISDELKKVSQFILSNKPKVVSESIDFPLSSLRDLMVKKYNEKYADLEESDRDILKVLINGDEEKQTALFTALVNECLTMVEGYIKNADSESMEKLLRTKDKLNNDKIELNSENFIHEFSKLVELKNNLRLMA